MHEFLFHFRSFLQYLQGSVSAFSFSNEATFGDEGVNYGFSEESINKYFAVKKMKAIQDTFQLGGEVTVLKGNLYVYVVIFVSKLFLN